MKKLLLTPAFFLTVFVLFGATALHVVPKDIVPGKDAELLLEITSGEADISTINIVYNVIESSISEKEPMRPESEDKVYWRGIIPKKVMMASAIEYRFEITLKNGQSVMYPEESGMTEPFVLRPMAPSGKLSRDFVLISDEEIVSADEGYVLAVSFFAIADVIDSTSIKIYVDNSDVTSKATIEGSILLYRETRPRVGLRSAIVTAKIKGENVYSETWTTQVTPGKLSSYIPFDYRGTINFAANIYDVKKDDLVLDSSLFGDNQQDYSTWADLYASYGPVDVETHLLFSSLENKNEQPVNRMMLGVMLPFINAYWGDYSPNLSDFTLRGKNVRGIYVDLFAQYMKLIVSHGEAVRKTIDEDSMTGTFKQESFGSRLQFGSDNGLRFAFNISRHRDTINSLDEAYYLRMNAAGDTTYAVTAKDNAVASFDIRLNVPDQNVMFGAEVAGSLLNTNTIPGILTDDEMEEYLGIELPITLENLTDLFVINKNMEPFIPSKSNVALNAYARMYIWNNLINVQYSSVGSAFNSYGSFFQANDTKTLSVSDQLTIGRFLMLYGGFSKTEDNISKFNTETNIYENIFAQMVLRIPNLPYLKASYFDNVGENSPMDEDDPMTAAMFMPNHQKSRNMSFGLGYNFTMIPYVPSQLDLSYRLGNSSNERAASLDDDLELISDNKTNGISVTMLNRFSILPLKTHFSYSNYKTENVLSDKTQTNNSFYAKADYSLWEDRIIPFVSYRVNSLSGSTQKLAYNYFNAGIDCFPIKDLSIGLDVGSKSFTNANDSDQNYSSTTLKFLVTQRF